MFKVKNIVLIFSVIFILLSLSCFVNAGKGYPNCEKGDALFREFGLLYPLISGFGHGAIYSIWNASLGNSNDTDTHFVIESSNDQNGVHSRTLTTSLNGKSYWGAFNSGSLTNQQRRDLVSIAAGQVGCSYAASGYPNIKNPGVSFRCDGLIEYCYEQIGVNGGDGYFTNAEEAQYFEVFYPSALMSRMSQDFGVEPIINSITDNAGDISSRGNVSTGIGISINATDGNNGSGLTLLEIWQGNPDSGGTKIQSCTGNYNVSNTYSIQNPPKTNDTFYVRVYDQAGNYTTQSFTIDTTPPDMPA